MFLSEEVNDGYKSTQLVLMPPTASDGSYRWAQPCGSPDSPFPGSRLEHSDFLSSPREDALVFHWGQVWPLSVRLALQGQPIATGGGSHDCCLRPHPRQWAQVSWEVLVESSPKAYGSDLNSICLYQLFFIFCLAPHLCSLGSPPQGGTCPQALISGSALRALPDAESRSNCEWGTHVGVGRH